MNFLTVEKDYLQVLREWRRDFHKFPEPGWLEFRTSAIIAENLEAWGYEVYVGKEIVHGDSMGVPDKVLADAFYKKAIESDVSSKWLEKMEAGKTGVIAVLDTGIQGPTIAYRVDIDALPILESSEEKHVPQQLNFRSQNDGFMHACGHDSHATIGLGLAQQLMKVKDKLCGKIIIIFQPAEEGVRGGSAIVASPLLDKIDYLCALHIGTGIPKGTFVAGVDGFLATTKFDVTIKGVAAHSGINAEQGKNALLASAQAALALHSLPPHSEGVARVNVGTLEAGSGRNIIPSLAKMQLEIRGETTAINSFYEERVEQIFNGVAAMYDVEVQLEKVGYALNIPSDQQLAKILKETAIQQPSVKEVIEYRDFKAGSEDATFLMQKVQKQGGLACYSIIGTNLAAGHHHEEFDIEEEDMLSALEIWVNVPFKLYEELKVNG
ncbi:amidohydrolase [Ureibacillus chungkukjangi]|uniref:Aminobenzoyl-glutamate utilization protein A n=1 Tax=Ureibacillus chungkukjangi TaxID=1202712 RepID=A0A318TPQ0_9BACL|nr:amidohydrolase [Ureibacillus chungkukjangi]MCM3387159.1 amidohydrolase [Ureibacillus chungkukjangi]PYF06842.1 aminobenzoyl-glutamate utilization protein A [Ureibacillus chungkukjangi]